VPPINLDLSRASAFVSSSLVLLPHVSVASWMVFPFESNNSQVVHFLHEERFVHRKATARAIKQSFFMICKMGLVTVTRNADGIGQICPII
jgi:hypothetical protein